MASGNIPPASSLNVEPPLQFPLQFYHILAQKLFSEKFYFEKACKKPLPYLFQFEKLYGQLKRSWGKKKIVFGDEAELTPLVSQQHWAGGVSGPVVPLATGIQVEPKHRRALQAARSHDPEGQGEEMHD